MPRKLRTFTRAELAAIIREATGRREERLRAEFTVQLEAERAAHRLEVASVRRQLLDSHTTLRRRLLRWLGGEEVTPP